MPRKMAFYTRSNKLANHCTFFFILSEDWKEAKAAAAEYAADEPEVPGVGVEPWGVYTSS